MNEPTQNVKQPELNEALRAWILIRARVINGTLLASVATISDDLDAGRHRAALGSLSGIERFVSELRSLLLLIP